MTEYDTLGALLGINAPEWMQQGLCGQTDPESWFPEKGFNSHDAKAICASCPVSAQCLDYALEHDERFGIWGGLSERQRREVKHALNPQAERVPCGRDGCDRTFANAGDRKRHHGNTHDRDETAFACPACDYTSPVRQGVTLHIRRNHPDLRTAS